MEFQIRNGSTIPIEATSSMELGRSLGLGLGVSPYSSDRTVSRRHLSIHTLDEISKLSFEVIGKNPIWVCSKVDGDKRVFRKFEKGELRDGDCFTLSLKNPVLLSFRSTGDGALDAVERRRGKEIVDGGNGDEQEVLLGELESGLGSLDVSGIDPVKEFGFLVRGHEFDHYPRQKIRAFKDWKWFLDEPEGSSDDEEFVEEMSTKRKKGGKRKKRRGGGDEDDDEWGGESEDEKALVAKAESSKRPKYSTRSKDPTRSPKSAIGVAKPGTNKGGQSYKDDIEEEDEEDETLAGFIADEGAGEEEEDDEAEDEYDED